MILFIMLDLHPLDNLFQHMRCNLESRVGLHSTGWYKQAQRILEGACSSFLIPLISYGLFVVQMSDKSISACITPQPYSFSM